MNEKRSFKKRLAGLLAMSLVLAMMMGMTVNAATTYFYSNVGGYKLYTDSGCVTPVPDSQLIKGGDTISYVGNDCGLLEIVINDTSEGYINKYNLSYPISGTDSYSFSVEGETLKLTTAPVISPTPNPQEPNLPAPNPQAPAVAQQQASCSHGGVETKVIKEPTETEDGIIGYYCTGCGGLLSTDSTSSYAYFLKSMIEKINKAEPRSTVEISSKIWNSLSQDVMLAMAARRDINVVMTFRYQHADYQYNIPAGTAIDTADKYYGPMYLGQLYGMTKLEK